MKESARKTSGDSLFFAYCPGNFYFPESVQNLGEPLNSLMCSNPSLFSM